MADKRNNPELATQKRIASALEDIAGKIGWGLLWLFLLMLGTCSQSSDISKILEQIAGG